MQRTLKHPIRIAGKGLHSGQMAELRLLPASAEYGIWFRRVDVADRDNLIPALYDHVSGTHLCTRLTNAEGVEVSTVEHLMAALAGTGVHNALIEIDGPEIPIMDGSSDRFVSAITKAGLLEQSAPIRAIRILKPVSVHIDGVSAALLPADNLEIEFTIDFDDVAIGRQSKRLNMSNGAFVRELSDSRTFCRRSDVDLMRSAGLALGGGLENAIVVDGADILNPEGFRHHDECVRHKMLDALGDLYLAGAPVIGRYCGDKAGHSATNLLLRKLFSTPNAWEMILCDDEQWGDLPGARASQRDLAHA